MIKIEWNEKTVKSLDKKLDKIIYGLTESTKKGIQEALISTQKLAIQLKPSGKSDEGILVQLLDTEKNQIKGRVYTDSKRFPYLVYLEFGTGIYADPEGGGSRAKKIPWYIHTSMADLSKYNYQIFTAPDGNQFYVCYGMHPHPYMRPAGFQNRDMEIELVEKAISEMIRKAIK